MSEFLVDDDAVDDEYHDEVGDDAHVQETSTKKKSAAELRREQLQLERSRALKRERAALVAHLVDEVDVDELVDRLVKCQRVRFESLRLTVQLGAQYPGTKPTFDCDDPTQKETINALYRRHHQQKQPLLFSKLLTLLTEEEKKLPASTTSTSSTSSTSSANSTTITLNATDFTQYAFSLAKSCEDSLRILTLICTDLDVSSTSATTTTKKKATIDTPLELETIVGVVVAAMLDAPETLVAKLWRLAAKAALADNSSSVNNGTKTRAFNDASQDPNAFDSRFNELMMFLLQRYNVELYKKFVKFDEAKNQHSRVTRSVVVGALASSRDKSLLLKEKIVAIVSVGGFTPLFPDEWRYLQLRNVIDRSDQSLRDLFVQSNRFISSFRSPTTTSKSKSDSSSSGGVLIHCFGGRSRSIVFATAYLIEHEKMSMNQALAAIAMSRPIISPNAGFLQQLRWFNNRLLRSQEIID